MHGVEIPSMGVPHLHFVRWGSRKNLGTIWLAAVWCGWLVFMGQPRFALGQGDFLSLKGGPSTNSNFFINFYTPVFRRDILWYGAVRPSVHPSVRPTFSTKKHRCKWRIFFKLGTQVCLGVPSINLLFVLTYLIRYVHNSITSDFSIFGIHRVIF